MTVMDLHKQATVSRTQVMATEVHHVDISSVVTQKNSDSDGLTQTGSVSHRLEITVPVGWALNTNN